MYNNNNNNNNNTNWVDFDSTFKDTPYILMSVWIHIPLENMHRNCVNFYAQYI